MSGQAPVVSGQRIQPLNSEPLNLKSPSPGEERAAGKGVGVRSSAAHDAAKAEYTAKKDKLKQTTQDFEAVFLGMMLKQMRKSVAGQNALFGNSHEARMFQDMMDETTAKNLSKAGTFGLSNLLFKTMERTLPPDPDKE